MATHQLVWVVGALVRSATVTVPPVLGPSERASALQPARTQAGRSAARCADSFEEHVMDLQALVRTKRRTLGCQQRQLHKPALHSHRHGMAGQGLSSRSRRV